MRQPSTSTVYWPVATSLMFTGLPRSSTTSTLGTRSPMSGAAFKKRSSMAAVPGAHAHAHAHAHAGDLPGRCLEGTREKQRQEGDPTIHETPETVRNTRCIVARSRKTGKRSAAGRAVTKFGGLTSIWP